MDKSLDAYLTQVAQQLKWLPPTAREAEVREVEDHLRTTVEAQQAQGVSYNDAVGESIRRFGDARRVGKSLARAWHKRQPESVGRAVLAFVVALVGQFFFLSGAVGLARLLWLPISPDDPVTSMSAESLFLLVIAPVLAGFFATVIAPRRGQTAARAAYLAVTVLFFLLFLLPSLNSVWHTRNPLVLASLLPFHRITLTLNLLLLGSIINILGGTWLAKVWVLRRATRQQFQNLQPVGGSSHNLEGDNNGS